MLDTASLAYLPIFLKSKFALSGPSASRSLIDKVTGKQVLLHVFDRTGTTSSTCAEASARQVEPSSRAKKEASSPSKNSSTTMLLPAYNRNDEPWSKLSAAGVSYAHGRLPKIAVGSAAPVERLQSKR